MTDSTAAATPTTAGLRRVVSRWELVGLSINDVIGSGVYLLPAAAAALLGPASLWAVLLAGFCVLLLVLCFAEAASHFDEPGSGYVYTRAAFGNFAGFEVGWMTWLARVASVASLANGFAQALTFIWPGAADGAMRIAVIVIPLAILTWVNIIGVKHGARVAVGFTIGKLVPLIVLIAFGIFAIDTSLLTPMSIPDVGNLGEAALLLLFAYAGFENTAAAAGEFKDPKRDVPFALITMLIVVTAVYTLIQLVALGTLPDLASKVEGAPLADAAMIAIGTGAGLLMTAGAVISIGGNIGSTMLAGPRYLFALARDGYGPRVLGHVHPRYGTPAAAILAQAVLSLILALSGSFVQLAMLSIIARLSTYIGTAAAVPFLRRRFPRTATTVVLPGGPLIPISALLLSLGLLASATRENLLAGLAAVIVGGVLYLFRQSPMPD
ncbi:MAG TPA: amino acid permease [Gemmatimonadaceae bacterium]|nr:amino acid permease [Gemmatimonadaceae bacterium]